MVEDIIKMPGVLVNEDDLKKFLISIFCFFEKLVASMPTAILK
jgi:hypothetical protein